MKRKKKIARLITLILMLLLTIVIGSVSVNAATDSGTFGKNGGNLTWEYDDQTKTLTISGTGEMEDWIAGYLTPWGSYQMQITTVVINDGVTNIGKEAFSNCHALTSVTLPNSVTDIRFHAFQGSENLKNINMPANLTTIGDGAFYGCHALTDVTIPDSVKTIGYNAFAHMDNLTNVVIGKNVETIESYAFSFTPIQAITIPKSVTELGGDIFYYCDDLTTIIYEGTEEQWNALTNGVSLGVDLSKVDVKIDTKWYVTYDLNGGTGINGFEPQEIQVEDGFENPIFTWDEIKDIIGTPNGKKYAGVEINGKKYNAGANFKVKEDIVIKILWVDINVPGNNNIGTAKPLAVKLAAKGKTALKISWNKINGVNGYDIFFAECNHGGKKIVCKNVKSIEGNNIFTWTNSGLKKGTAYKSYVKAYVMKNGRKVYVSTSPVMHAYTGNGNKKYTNAKSVTIKNVKKGKLSLKKNKTFKIKAKVNKVNKGKKLMPKGHAPTLRYMTSDSKVATVNSKGKITAKGKGTCVIYVYAHNGISKSIKVTVP